MSFLDRLLPAALIRDLAPVQARAAAPFEVNIPGLFPTRYAQGNWYPPTVRQALSSPPVLRCVTLISNTAGALSMNAYDDGVRVEAKSRPRLIVRPNPRTTPRVFWRDSAFWKATYGEQPWWIAKRDSDGLASSLWPIPPYELKVEEDERDPGWPRYEWRGRRVPRTDIVMDTLLPDPDHPFRGIGPLQLCGAALSAAVEAEHWAANFYSEGGYASIVMRHEGFDTEDDAQKFKERWVSTPNNTPHLVTGVEDIKEIPVDEAGAQMLSSRTHAFGVAALAFGIPGRMVEYVQSGASLTYANIGDVFDEFVKTCLWPNYLEGTEQVMTDLLPRSWTVEFDTDRFTRPDPKTRAEIHKLNIESGVYDAEYAKLLEGITPGSIETAPIPPSPPAALPVIPQARAAAPEVEYRCDNLRPMRKSGIVSLVTCGKLLSKGVAPHPGFPCPRCKAPWATAA